MNSSGIKIRWITTTCFEIVLPNGKVIVLDPWVGKEHPMHPGVSVDTGFSVDDFTGADYIFRSYSGSDGAAGKKTDRPLRRACVFAGVIRKAVFGCL